MMDDATKRVNILKERMMRKDMITKLLWKNKYNKLKKCAKVPGNRIWKYCSGSFRV